MFEDQNRIKRTELAEEVQRDLLTQTDHDKLDGFILDQDGGVSFAYSIEMNVNGVIYKFDGTKDVDITITPESVGAATVDHTHPPQINISGNSATTTKLKTPVNIGNASFDGTQSITLTDIGVASANHNHDTIYSKIDHNHDKDYSDINHNHDTDYSDIDHTHLYAGSAKSGGPATTALKFDKELKLKVSGALSGETKFSGDEGEAEIEVELGSHNHTLNDIDFTGNAVVMEPTDYEIIAPDNPNAEGIGAQKHNFAFHTYNSDEKYIIFELYDVVSGSSPKVIPTMFLGGSTSTPNGEISIEDVDNYILNIEYLDANYSPLGSEVIDETTVNQNVPVGTKYIKTISSMLISISYTEKDTFLVKSIDANNASELFMRIYCEERSDESTDTYCLSLNLKSFSIITDRFINWTGLFSGCTKLEEVNITIKGGRNLTFDRTFEQCKKLTNVQIKLPKQTIVSAIAMFKGCTSMTLPPNDLDYSNFRNMESMFEGSGIYKFPNESFRNNERYVNLNRMFADCLNLSGEIHLPNYYVNIVDAIIPVVDIVHGTRKPITVYHHAKMPMIENDILSNPYRQFKVTGGIVFTFGNTLPSNVDFSFRCTPLINSSSINYAELTAISCLIDKNTGDLTTSTSKSFTISMVDADTINTVSIGSCNYLIIKTYSLIEEFQYSDLTEIKSIEAFSTEDSAKFTTRFSVLKRDNEWNHLTQSTGLEYFSMNTVGITDMKRAFYGCDQLISVYVNTSNATDMNGMFEGCSSLRTFPQLDTSKVIDVNHMFFGCSWLLMKGARIDIWNDQGEANPMLPIVDCIYDMQTPIEISYFSNNTEMDKYVKANKDFITGVIIDEFNISKSSTESGSTNSAGIDSLYCIHLATNQVHPSTPKILSITVSSNYNLDENLVYIKCLKTTEVVPDLEYVNEEIVSYDYKINMGPLTVINVEIPPETDLINIYGDFYNLSINAETTADNIINFICDQMPNLTNLTIDSKFKKILTMFKLGRNNISNVDSMFSSYIELNTVEMCISDSVKSMSDTFSGCTKLNTVKLYQDKYGCNHSGITMNSTFFRCTNLRDVSIGISNITDTYLMFNYCSNLETAPFFDTSRLTRMEYMFSECKKLKNVPLFNTSNVTNMSYMFSRCSSLTTIPLFDTSNTTDMDNMFNGCTSLTSIPLLDTSKVKYMSSMFRDCSSLTSIPLLDTSSIVSTANMFSGCTSLTSIHQINTSRVTYLNQMFKSCSALTSIPNLDTFSATNMSGMFEGCSSITEVPLLDTSNVTNMSGMFNRCTSLTSIPEFNTLKVTDMKEMFKGCSALKTIPLLNTTNVINMSGMFYGCTSLTSVPLLTTTRVTNMSTMFYGCNSLNSIPLLDTANISTVLDMLTGVTVPKFMFYIAPRNNSTTNYRLPSIINPSKLTASMTIIVLYNKMAEKGVLTNMVSTYSGTLLNVVPVCIEDAVMLKIGTYTSSEKIYAAIMDKAATGYTLSIGCTSINKDGTAVEKSDIVTSAGSAVDISSSITSSTDYLVIRFNESNTSGNRNNVNNIKICPNASLDEMNNAFSKEFIEGISLMHFSQLFSEHLIPTHFTNVSRVSVYRTTTVTDVIARSFFYYKSDLMEEYRMVNLVAVDFFDTSYATIMNNMFKSCSSLGAIPALDTSKVTDMDNMFEGCSSLGAIPVLDTSQATYMNWMFKDCSTLSAIPALNTSKVTRMQGTFNKCTSLTSIPLLDTSKVENMKETFMRCTSLTSIPLLDTSKVENMSSMFYGCKSLTSIPKLNTSNVVNMDSIFRDCSSLNTIPLLDTFNVTNMSDMFNGCTSLTSVPLFDTSKVSSFGHMFAKCIKLKYIPNFHIVKQNDGYYTFMHGMFEDCYSLITIPEFDTSGCVWMSSMFKNCYSLTRIPWFNASSVEDMTDMCNNCSSLRDFPYINTANVRYMNRMFYGCTSLMNIFGEIEMSSCLDTEEMFAHCTSLSEIPRLINTSKLENINSMFLNCKSLQCDDSISQDQYVYFEFDSVTSVERLFYGCISLRGKVSLSTLVSITTEFKANNFEGTIFPIEVSYPSKHDALFIQENMPSNITLSSVYVP